MSLIEKIALKPCPFCGCDVQLVERTDRDPMYGYRKWYHIEGKHTGIGGVCPGQVRGRGSAETAIAAWNNRAALTAIMDAGDGVPSEAAWELADKIVLGNQGVGNAAALIEPALVAAAAAERARIVAGVNACELSSGIPDDPAQIVRDLADAIERGEV